MRRKLSYSVSDYRSTRPRTSNDMYTPEPGYQVATNVPAALGRIAQTILSRAVDEGWQMPSEIPLYFEGKRYIAKYQWHGPNSGNPKKHPGIGLYEQIDADISEYQTKKVLTKTSENEIIQTIMREWQSVFGTTPSPQQAFTAYGQLAMETGHGNQCYNYNVGNINWTRGFNGKFYTTKDSSSINGNPANRNWYIAKMRSYDSLADGVKDYLKWIKNHKNATAAAISADPKAFSHALAEAGYYDPHMRDDYVDANGKKQAGNTTGAVGIFSNLMKKNDAGKLDLNVPKPNYSIDTSSIGGFISSIERILDNFMSTASKPTGYLISLGSDNDFASKLEFAAVLKTALEEELKVKSDIYVNNTNIEVMCKISDQKALDALNELCYAVSDTFEYATRKIGGVKIYTTILQDQNPSCQELDIKLAEINHRKFLLKFCKVRS